MLNSMVIFNFFFLDWIYSCWINFAKKFKIVSLSWNLIPRLFWIFKSWWWCSLVLFLFFSSKFYQKIPFGMLVLPDYSPGSLLAETWSKWFFSFQTKNEKSQASNSHFSFLGYQPWFAIIMFLFKPYFVTKVDV